MKRPFLAIILLILLVSGIVVLAQSGGEEQTFTLEHEFGKARPQGIQYNPDFDQVIFVDLQGRLVLADATNFQPQHILYEQGAYNSYRFSHNGRYLALALETRIELWNTQTGNRDAVLNPEGALSVTGPLHFAEDDRLLLFDSVVPAPAATRRSENDTSIIPWVWDLPAARDEARPTLPNREDAYPFFNFRNGLILGPNDTLIAAIPNRLQVIDARARDFSPVVAEIVTGRLERDPISLWRSATDDFIYVRPINRSAWVQLDTTDYHIAELPLGRDLRLGSFNAADAMRFSRINRIIGEPMSLGENALVRLLWGDDYRARFNSQPITVMILDMLEPITSEASENGLLIYTFLEEDELGFVEFMRPADVQQMSLSPDENHLLVRRAGGLQQIELYDLSSGVLEKTYYPNVLDGNGRNLFSFTQNGDAVLTDFHRFDTQTAETLYLDRDYGFNFGRFYAAEGDKINTVTGDLWQQWDAKTGALIRQDALRLNGDVREISADGSRYLTMYQSRGILNLEILDMGTGERETTSFELLPTRSVQAIYHTPNWRNTLVVYEPDQSSQHYPGNEIAAYTWGEGQIVLMAGDDLPAPEARRYGWLNDSTFFVASDAPGSFQPQRIYGLDYHVSGLPQCLVDAYPQEWESLLDLWEQLNVRLSWEGLAAVTQFLCDNRPDAPGEIADLLTPTPRFSYRSDATRIPYAVVGVPVCLTANFRSEALEYAETWRTLIQGLDEAQIAELETMVCEGLIFDLSGIRATPTVNPNTIGAATATPVPQGPGSEQIAERLNAEVMTYNINAGERYFGPFIPPIERTSTNLSLILNDFQGQFGYTPNEVSLSPDGTLLVIRSSQNTMQSYRLGKSYPQVVMEATETQSAQQGSSAGSIGLRPTSTPAFELVGEPRPTLTATISPTPPPLAADYVPLPDYQRVVEYCPYDHLFDISNPPPDYAATGRLIVPQVSAPIPWILEPETGYLTAYDALPRCDLGACQFSPDLNWILRRTAAGLEVSRPDGSDTTVLFPAEEEKVWPGNFYWLPNSVLEYSYQGYIDEPLRGPITVYQQFDPVTGELSEPFQKQINIVVNELPTQIISVQPVEERFYVVGTPYNNGAETKYHIYDMETETATYFARSAGGLSLEWHPLGTALYYWDGSNWVIFDPETQQHYIFNGVPDGLWSRDYRYRITWYADNVTAYRILQQQRIPKITIWDSETGLIRRYCIPETGANNQSTNFTWSPDNRYVAFRIFLPGDGDDPLRQLVQIATVQAAQPTQRPIYATPTLEATPPFQGTVRQLPTLVPSPTPFPTTTPQPGAFFDVPPVLTPQNTLTPPTAIPLETQYQLQNPRTLLLDTQTGSITILSDVVGDVLYWINDPQGGEQ